MWWKSEVNKVSYFKIKTENLTIYVGSKPHTSGMTEDFSKSIDSWISLTTEDYPYIYDLPWHSSYHWYPLVETEQWDLKPYYFIKTLLDFYKNKTLYIHCDLGSHRSPHLTLLWLFHKYGQEKTFNMLDLAEYNLERNKGTHSKDVIRTFKNKINNGDLYSHHPFEKELVNILFDEMDIKSSKDLEGYIDIISSKTGFNKSTFSYYEDQSVRDLKSQIVLLLDNKKKHIIEFLTWFLIKDRKEKSLIIESKRKYKLPLRWYQK